MISIEKDVFLPGFLRGELRKPFGRVMECSEIIELLKGKPGKLVTIGDSVSTALIKGGLEPSLIIWDERIKRHPTSEESETLLSNYAPITRVRNPPGAITKEAWGAVTAALEGDRESILVDGEEDLLTIPVILNADEGTRVVYGFPPEKGAILIDVNRKIKSVFQDILSRFRR